MKRFMVRVRRDDGAFPVIAVMVVAGILGLGLSLTGTALNDADLKEAERQSKQAQTVVDEKLASAPAEKKEQLEKLQTVYKKNAEQATKERYNSLTSGAIDAGVEVITTVVPVGKGLKVLKVLGPAARKIAIKGTRAAGTGGREAIKNLVQNQLGDPAKTALGVGDQKPDPALDDLRTREGATGAERKPLTDAIDSAKLRVTRDTVSEATGIPVKQVPDVLVAAVAADTKKVLEQGEAAKLKAASGVTEAGRGNPTGVALGVSVGKIAPDPASLQKGVVKADTTEVEMAGKSGDVVLGATLIDDAVVPTLVRIDEDKLIGDFMGIGGLQTVPLTDGLELEEDPAPSVAGTFKGTMDMKITYEGGASTVKVPVTLTVAQDGATTMSGSYTGPVKMPGTSGGTLTVKTTIKLTGMSDAARVSADGPWTVKATVTAAGMSFDAGSNTGEGVLSGTITGDSFAGAVASSGTTSKVVATRVK